MHDAVAGAIVIAVIFTGIVSIIRTILSYNLKRKLLESGQVDEKAVNILGDQEEGRYTALKWGLVILFGGVGLVLLEFIPHNINSPFPYGFVSSFIAAGFLIYYFLVRKEISNH
jgi:hypothetical protein